VAAFVFGEEEALWQPQESCRFMLAKAAQKVGRCGLLLHSHDNDRVYIEKLQATIPSIDIRKKLAIRERLGGI